MKNTMNNNIVPIKTYSNAERDKFIIYKDNNNKSGIYRWNNLITNKSYIGSAKSIRGRFSIYYSTNSVQRKLAEGSSAIYSAILKYGYGNFSIDILEYCDISTLIEREQYYIDLLEPEYNILKIAYSREGAKHTEITKSCIGLKSLGRKHTEEAKLKMREIAILRKGEETSFYGKNHSPESLLKMSMNRSIQVKVIDTVLNEETVFLGNKEAAEFLNVGLSTLVRYKKLNKLIKERYLVSNKLM